MSFCYWRKIKNEPDINLRKSGSIALDLAYVAAGKYDGCFQKNLNLWDVAAGLILVKEAGGIIDEINSKVYNNLKIISSTPNINLELHKRIKI